MPKGKSKRTSSATNISPRDFPGDVAHAGSWKNAVEIIRNRLRIPVIDEDLASDISTTSGLKKIYSHADDIYCRLDKALQEYEQHDRIVRGIIGIYTQIYEDSLLRNKFVEKGLLARLFPLLKRDACRNKVLSTLVNVSHHGGSKMHAEVAQYTLELVQTLLDYPDEPLTAKLIITVVSHSVSAAVNGPIEALRRQNLNQPRYTIDTRFLATLSECTFRSEPELDKFLVAGLKSKDWGIRGFCLGAIVRSFMLSGVVDRAQMDIDQLDQLLSKEHHVPSHILAAFNKYGIYRLQSYQQRETFQEIMNVVEAALQHRDYYVLGIKYAEFVLQTEYSLPDYPELPLKEVIPLCVNALRAKGSPGDMDRADIVELKYLVMHQRWDEISLKSQQCLLRNPNSPYTYYAISILPNSEDGLRAAKKGLKCKHINTFMKFQLLYCAVDLAAFLGISYFHQVEGHRRLMWEEAVAFLMSALEDSRTYIKEAPPDSIHLKTVLYWNIMLTLTLEGPNANLQLVQRAMKKLELSEDISNYLKAQILQTEGRGAAKMIVRLFKDAEWDWGEGIQSMDERLDEQVPAAEFSKAATDELALWLSDMSLGETFKCSAGIYGSRDVRIVTIPRPFSENVQDAGMPDIAIVSARNCIGQSIRNSVRLNKSISVVSKYGFKLKR
ncbi:hypothetical protein BT96DRAFT_946213 [Gymnopus androsaceus JB14]|uniref:ARM repeat-containing protein n=1 Tax=Gymnopus androsaceus JB14 TaxID=1447944 RepID=A0A6A4GXZ9_9AGAR|nr:hypothetical protein BT96DRAFT_946213 [Gymnopus androsaceus JB14]